MSQIRPHPHRLFDQLLRSRSVASLYGNHPQFILGNNVVWVEFEFPAISLFSLLRLARDPKFCAELLVESRLVRSQMDGRPVFSDRVQLPLGVGVCSARIWCTRQDFG